MKKESKKKTVRAVKEIIDGEVFYTCTKCGKQLPENCYYGRNRVCKNCYNPKKVNNSGIWHCKYCGETNENKRFRNYLFCKGCAKTRYLPKGITEWKCKDCGTTDVTQRVDIQMLCKKCYNLRANNRHKAKKPIIEAQKLKAKSENELAQTIKRMLSK
jgi:ribosomal protein L37AE/L43A